jgi:HAD superfamily hydrolase (TIGR01549 family)
MLTAVIFDVDGTLVDSVDQHASAWQQALRDFGHDVDFQSVRGQIGKGGDQLLPVFLSQEALKQHGEELERHRSQIFKDNYLSKVIGFPGVRGLFQRLKMDGKKIALASSAKQDELEIYKRIAGIEDLVHRHSSSDGAEKSKPSPDIFEAALKQLAYVDRREVIVVGDTPYDADAAGKAGIRTIGLLSGGFAEPDLRDSGCIAIYRDPADLLRRYDASPLGEG